MIVLKNPLKFPTKFFVTSGIVLSSVVLSPVAPVAAVSWRLSQTFNNPTPEVFDNFGSSVAIDGNNVLIGAAGDNTAGVDNAGGAYLFDGVTGNLSQTFLNPTPESFDNFGGSVAISGNNVLIGAAGDNTGAQSAGAVYLFNGETGNLLQTFLNPTPEAYDGFGVSVSISGNNVLIGAYEDNTGGENAGAAYLFDAATGNLLQTFFNPTPKADDRFGRSVAISGNNVLIGAPGEDNTRAENVGAAYLFDALTGNLLQTFRNPYPYSFDIFGTSVSISGNNVLIGAPSVSIADGEAYLFDGETGNRLQTFRNPYTSRRDRGEFFGISLSISGNNVLIQGGRSRDGVYLFNGTTGRLLQTFFYSFGSSVSISGNNVLIGVPYDNTGADNAGAAYLYKPVPEPLTILGAGSAAVLGCFYKRRLAKKR